jgi:hypothetical protein
MKARHIFCVIFYIYISKKAWYFNTEFVFLWYKNTNQYYKKLIENTQENHKVFWKKIFWNFLIFFGLT